MGQVDRRDGGIVGYRYRLAVPGDPHCGCSCAGTVEVAKSLAMVSLFRFVSVFLQCKKVARSI